MLFAAALSMLSSHSASDTAIVNTNRFKAYVERFNGEDAAAGRHEELSIPNDQAWSFLDRNVPWFDCPDKQLEETYVYRWWSYRKHLKQTLDGWVVSEFLPDVPWAGIFNTISCAAGHHLYEGRWLRDPRYMRDYAEFWLYPEAQPRLYSCWLADSVQAVIHVTGDRRMAQNLLPNLVANYRAWERTNRDATGLFHQVDDRDGMEYSLGGSGYRPSINAYMFGDASAIANIAKECGEHALANEFKSKAADLKRLVQTELWNPHDGFFETKSTDLSREKVREEIGFIPWYFNLPDPNFQTAWRQLRDPQGFAAPFGPTTAERRAAGFMHLDDHDCLWNGPSWPYATTQTLVAMANLLNEPGQDVVSKSDYFDLLRRYSQSQQKDGRPWIAEDLDAATGKWIVDLPRSVNYNHSGFADLIIGGLVGIRPRSDDELIVNPLVPKDTWAWFCLDGVPYHGHSVTVLWDADGTHYGRGQGLSLLVGGQTVARRNALGEIRCALSGNRSRPLIPPSLRWQKHKGPVLGGKLGTCFDISVLQQGPTFKMYFSWRPKKSIAVVESPDGVHWSEPRIVLEPAATGWEEDLNRPSVILQGGRYHMWYTGQFNGHSSIGYCTSDDGIHWERRKDPVLQAVQPWEKVAAMCPSVLWEDKSHEFRMWYSGGEQYEPDAIGYASSPDGVHWQKHDGPIFQADPANRWEQSKVTACQVLEREGWHVMFYIGFRDIDHAQIGIARSRDGMTNWERMRDNPIIVPTVDGWDADACYKPFAIFDEDANLWRLWYNGRHGAYEQIGLATKSGANLGFP